MKGGLVNVDIDETSLATSGSLVSKILERPASFGHLGCEAYLREYCPTKNACALREFYKTYADAAMYEYPTDGRTLAVPYIWMEGLASGLGRSPPGVVQVSPGSHPMVFVTWLVGTQACIREDVEEALADPASVMQRPNYPGRASSEAFIAFGEEYYHFSPGTNMLGLALEFWAVFGKEARVRFADHLRECYGVSAERLVQSLRAANLSTYGIAGAAPPETASAQEQWAYQEPQIRMQ